MAEQGEYRVAYVRAADPQNKRVVVWDRGRDQIDGEVTVVANGKIFKVALTPFVQRQVRDENLRVLDDDEGKRLYDEQQAAFDEQQDENAENPEGLVPVFVGEAATESEDETTESDDQQEQTEMTDEQPENRDDETGDTTPVQIASTATAEGETNTETHDGAAKPEVSDNESTTAEPDLTATGPTIQTGDAAAESSAADTVRRPGRPRKNG